MRRLMAVMVTLGLLVPAMTHAGSYTITTTPEQEQALALIAARLNAAGKAAMPARTAPSNTTVLPQTIVQQAVDQYLAGAVEDVKREASRQAACAKVTDAQAKQTLGCAPTK
jgi:hypothetical protein